MGKSTSLTVKGVEKLKNKAVSKRYSDAGTRCLYLQTTKSKTASWIFQWRDPATKKLRQFGLGSVEDVSLAEARTQTADLRKQVKDGADPIAQKRRERSERIAEHAKALTLKETADAFYAAKIKHTGLTEKHKKRWRSMLEAHVYPKIGNILVREIETSHIESVLSPIWNTKLDTAKKIRQNLEKVLGYAATRKLRTGDNPARWENNLKDLLAAPKEIKKAKPVQHHKAVPWNEIHNFTKELRKRDGIAAKAVEFTVLTAARSGEVRQMTWDEVDLDNALWVIPAGRMRKNDKRHTVPLCKDAVSILKKLPRHESSNYVFWAPKGGALSDMSLTAVLRRMKADATVHGFRSTFKDWARKQNLPDEWSELALSHVNSDATRAAYARDELIEERTLLMSKWAKFINTKPNTANNVTLLKSGHTQKSAQT